MEQMWVESQRAAVEKALGAAIQSGDLVGELKDALNYAVFPGGKRIRPLLAVAICLDLGGDPAEILPGAAALELLHCSSLIHDDLPALDNDDMRRGKPSCHRAFSEATALLAGDVAISEAFRCSLRAAEKKGRSVEVAREVAQAYSELCNGQQLDLLAPPERGDVLELYAKKTGALFGAAIAIGAIGADKSADFIGRARELGIKLGILFQLHDDRIDASPEKGRSGGSDSRNQKPVAVATEDPARFEKLRSECVIALARLEESSAALSRVRSLASSLLSGG